MRKPGEYSELEISVIYSELEISVIYSGLEISVIYSGLEISVIVIFVQCLPPALIQGNAVVYFFAAVFLPFSCFSSLLESNISGWL